MKLPVSSASLDNPFFYQSSPCGGLSNPDNIHLKIFPHPDEALTSAYPDNQSKPKTIISELFTNIFFSDFMFACNGVAESAVEEIDNHILLNPLPLLKYEKNFYKYYIYTNFKIGEQDLPFIMPVEQPKLKENHVHSV